MSTLALSALSCALFVSLGLGAVLLILRKNMIPYTDSGQQCAKFPGNLTSFSMRKSSVRHFIWQYRIDDFPGIVQHDCPSRKCQVSVYKNDKLVTRSESGQLPFMSKTAINDCHGNHILTIYPHTETELRTRYLRAYAEKYMYNNDDSDSSGSKAKIAFSLMDERGKVVAYGAGKPTKEVKHGPLKRIDLTQNTNEIIIKNKHNKIVARMKRFALADGFEWKFTIYNRHHPAADPRILSVIAGREACGDLDSHNETCNILNTVSTIILVAIVLFVVIGICFTTGREVFGTSS